MSICTQPSVTIALVRKRRPWRGSSALRGGCPPRKADRPTDPGDPPASGRGGRIRGAPLVHGPRLRGGRSPGTIGLRTPQLAGLRDVVKPGPMQIVLDVTAEDPEVM